MIGSPSHTGDTPDEERVEGHLLTGDDGYFDDDSRRFVNLRTDELIVPGDEHVYPREVEEVLERNEHVNDPAVIAVDDEEFDSCCRRS